MPSYLLRVQLEDRPGSLGSLAVALGSVNADILSLDVVERTAGYAIDDVVVELPGGAMPDMLITAAEQLDGVRVDSLRPHTGLLEAHRELELIQHIVAADTPTKLQVLANEAPRTLRVSWCIVVRLSNPTSNPNINPTAKKHSATGENHATIERIVGSPAAPETRMHSAPWLPIAHAEALDGTADWVPQAWRDRDTTLAAAPLGQPNTAVVLGRTGGPLFRPAEVARLGYLSGIVATLLRQ